MTIYRVVVHNIEILNRKGNNRHNFCYAITNRLPYKQQTDEEDLKLYEEMMEEKRAKSGLKHAPGLKKSRSLNKETEEELLTEDEKKRRHAAFMKSRFESRYLTCPFNVGSFDIFTYTGKSMVQLEREAYKIFEFMEKAFGLDLLNLVTDWIRDANDHHWFIGVKSYMLTEEGFKSKVFKPSIFDRDLMDLNKVKRPRKSKNRSNTYTFLKNTALGAWAFTSWPTWVITK